MPRNWPILYRIVGYGSVYNNFDACTYFINIPGKNHAWFTFTFDSSRFQFIASDYEQTAAYSYINTEQFCHYRLIYISIRFIVLLFLSSWFHEKGSSVYTPSMKTIYLPLSAQVAEETIFWNSSLWCAWASLPFWTCRTSWRRGPPGRGRTAWCWREGSPPDPATRGHGSNADWK